MNDVLGGRGFDDLLRDVPDRVRLSPVDAWNEASRRRRRRRVGAAGSALVLAGGLTAAVLAVTPASTDRLSPAPAPGSTFVRAERDGATWQVLRSDGTTLTIEPRIDAPQAVLGISPDGHWLSYGEGPESGRIITLYLQRADEAAPTRVDQVSGATWGFAHQWSPDNQLVTVPVVDADVNVVATDATLVTHQSPPGTAAGFVDDDSLGWVRARGTRGDQGLTWTVTDLDMAPERTLTLDVGPELLSSPGWGQLGVHQASLSPDASRLAVLMADARGRARLMVFATSDGRLLGKEDSTDQVDDLECPLRWGEAAAQLTAADAPCVIEPGP